VHGHETWGVVGIYSGIEREVRYLKPVASTASAALTPAGEEREPGQVSVCCTTDDDVQVDERGFIKRFWKVLQEPTPVTPPAPSPPTPTAHCSDGIDNDTDRAIDYPRFTRNGVAQDSGCPYAGGGSSSRGRKGCLDHLRPLTQSVSPMIVRRLERRLIADVSMHRTSWCSFSVFFTVVLLARSRPLSFGRSERCARPRAFRGAVAAERVRHSRLTLT
jgi:hypothetical protein